MNIYFYKLLFAIIGVYIKQTNNVQLKIIATKATTQVIGGDMGKTRS